MIGTGRSREEETCAMTQSSSAANAVLAPRARAYRTEMPLRLVNIRHAMFMLASSWNSSLAA